MPNVIRKEDFIEIDPQLHRKMEVLAKQYEEGIITEGELELEVQEIMWVYITELRSSIHSVPPN
jgi:hypothetical protein